MIRSTFAGFNTATLALSASQRALDVTGQNLSNINTQGYTRQRLDQVSLSPSGPSMSSSQYDSKVGQGVMMIGVSQIRDPFLDVQYRNQLPKVGTADAMDSILAQIGQIFDETDKDAIAVEFDKIISALQNLGDPGNTGTDSADMVVRSACEVLLNTIHQNGNQIQEVYNELMTKLDENVVPQINSYLQQIVDLNISIRNTQVLGNPALELQDNRNELIDALATYFPIEVTYEEKNLGGGITVDLLNIDLRLADGSKIRIVEDDECGEIGIAKELVDGKEQIVEPVEIYVTEAGENPKTYGGGETEMPKALQKEIQGYIDDIASLNESIKNNMAQLDQLKSDLQTAKNTTADDCATAVNNCMEDIADLNSQIAAAQAAQPQNTKTLAKLQKLRTQAVEKLKSYFPNSTVVSTGTGLGNQISIEGNGTTHYLVNGNQYGSVSVNKNAVTGNVDEPVTFNLTSAPDGNNNITTFNSITTGSAVTKAMTNATEDIEEQIAAKERRIELLDNQRADKIEGLESYFPADTIETEKNTPDNGIISVKAGDQTLIADDNTKSVVSVAEHTDGSVTLNVADNEKALEALDKATEYVDDIVELNNAIQSNNDKIAALEQSALNAGTDASVARINGYIDTIAELNKQINEENSAADTDENKIKELEEQRTQAFNKLKTYFQDGALTTETDGVVSLEGTQRTSFVLVDADGTKGSVAADKDADGNVSDPPTLEVTAANGSKMSPNGVGNSVELAIEAANSDVEEEINSIKEQNVKLDEQRNTKLQELTDLNYFAVPPAATTTPAGDPNGMMSIKVDGEDLIDTNNVAATITATGDSSGKISDSALVIPENVVNRSKVSINDLLDEGVLKGDLDMLNKAEIFDKDVANNISATDTKGIQYYQNMLDTFINQFATEMNRLNAITEQKPVVDDDGNPVYELDAEGDVVMEPVLDKNGDPVMEPVYKTDADGNYLDKDGKVTTNEDEYVPEMEQVKQTVMQPKLEEKQGETIDGDKYTYYDPVYEQDADGNYLDKDGNITTNEDEYVPVMEEVEVYVNQPKMQAKLQPKQAMETVVTQQPLFETTDGSSTFTATNIKVSDAWMSNDIKINVQRDPSGEGNSSDNWNVERMIDALSSQTFDFIDPQSGKVFTGTLYECYTSIQRVQSVERQATSQILDTHTQVLDQIADSKDSVSGVWMDEEVMSLMKYSQSYNAASRLMTVMDEVLERLINQTGACGR